MPRATGRRSVKRGQGAACGYPIGRSTTQAAGDGVATVSSCPIQVPVGALDKRRVWPSTVCDVEIQPRLEGLRRRRNRSRRTEHHDRAGASKAHPFAYTSVHFEPLSVRQRLLRPVWNMIEFLGPYSFVFPKEAVGIR
jgi:hypothetical protein